MSLLTVCLIVACAVIASTEGRPVTKGFDATNKQRPLPGDPTGHQGRGVALSASGRCAVSR